MIMGSVHRETDAAPLLVLANERGGGKVVKTSVDDSKIDKNSFSIVRKNNKKLKFLGDIYIYKLIHFRDKKTLQGHDKLDIPV